MPRTILIVEDNPITRKMLRIAVEAEGHRAIEASNARTALAAAEGALPDLVLQDLVLPDMDGLELLRRLRALPGASELPILALSGFLSRLEESRTADAAFTALLVKPIEPSRLVELIDIYLPGRVGPAPAEPPNDQLKLKHARLVIHQLERQALEMGGLAQRCAVQTAQLSLLSGVADALTQRADADLALRDVLAATLEAAGISKGALILKGATGALQVRQSIGFSEEERPRLQGFFGHVALLDDIVAEAASVSVPSSAIPTGAADAILGGAAVASMQIVPLVAGGQGMGAMVIGATHTDVTSEDSVVFARAMGNQIVQSLELAKSVARLTASEQRYRTLLDGANDAIAVLTPDGVVRQMNRRWVEISGRPHEQLVGRHVREFAPTGQEDSIIGTFGATVDAVAGRTPPVEIATSTGASVFLEFSSTTVDVAGEQLVFAIGRDVTQQRQLEEQLRQAQKLEAIGQLAGGIAHDFNNLLTAILGFSEVLIADLGPDDRRRLDVLQIQTAGERAAGLTRQLLAFSRKQILQSAVLDINALITGLEPMLRRLIVEHINLVVSLSPDVRPVTMDPSQLEQILINLAVNAADAMPLGGALTIETANVTLDEHYRQHLPITPGDYVMLAVSDSGVGMDQATRVRIFEPFFTTKELGKGTGLGLATVYGIVKQSGGDIRVYSEPGHGSTFKVYLPPAMAGASEAAPLAPVVFGDVARGSETILLVEDDEGVRRLSRLTLERNGYRVVEAENPKQAIRVATETDGPIDLLLSDVIMPESEGPPLFQRLVKTHPGLRVLYMSGYADEAIVRLGVFVEGTPFLQKPFTPLALSRKVRSVLDAPSSLT